MFGFSDYDATSISDILRVLTPKSSVRDVSLTDYMTVIQITYDHADEIIGNLRSTNPSCNINIEEYRESAQKRLQFLNYMQKIGACKLSDIHLMIANRTLNSSLIDVFIEGGFILYDMFPAVKEGYPEYVQALADADKERRIRTFGFD